MRSCVQEKKPRRPRPRQLGSLHPRTRLWRGPRRSTESLGWRGERQRRQRRPWRLPRNRSEGWLDELRRWRRSERRISMHTRKNEEGCSRRQWRARTRCRRVCGRNATRSSRPRSTPSRRWQRRRRCEPTLSPPHLTMLRFRSSRLRLGCGTVRVPWRLRMQRDESCRAALRSWSPAGWRQSNCEENSRRRRRRKWKSCF
mmetsp:Transcript_18196/g.39545  ORF Transcript_18196/g.39545 Transcript_18196/m.39545 type:complete len:200 (-) Transcript_18196:692-1291(-)